LIYSGKDAQQVVVRGFNQQPINEEVLLEGVVSRKKQFVPVVMGMLMA
jgi:inorganic pyrophosphatase/exopolyphosphatase